MPVRIMKTINMVPTVGLEPTQLAPPPPQDGVSTNSTTSALLSRTVVTGHINFKEPLFIRGAVRRLAAPPFAIASMTAK